MERWQLTTKELARYSVIENVIKGYLKTSQAAEQLYLSPRQVFRLKKVLREEGIVGLIHGNRGRARLIEYQSGLPPIIRTLS